MRTQKVLVLGGSMLCVSSIILFFFLHSRVTPFSHDFKERGMNEWGIKYKSQVSSSPALYYCNFPVASDALSNEEGRPPNTQWVLKQVQVVIRHGDRSPIDLQLYRKLGVWPDYCQIQADRQPTHPSLGNFLRAITTDKIKMNMQGRKLLFSPIPNYPVCGSATLSQLGVVQHLHNGELSRKAYVEGHGILSGITSNQTALSQKVLVISTSRSRTLQSAVAFLYGLIPNFQLPHIEIKYSNSDIFGASPCHAVNLMEQGIKRVRYQSYLNHHKNGTFQKLADIYGMTDRSGVLIDGLVNGFLCKNIDLPCNVTCPSLEDLDVLLNVEESVIREISEKESFINQSMLYAQPLLNRISHLMTLSSLNSFAPEVVVMSGHDTTLKPLIRALGVPEYRWPRLGTRLVFELWMDPYDKKHYIRILLNGKDYTTETYPCIRNQQNQKINTQKYCSAESFHSYVSDAIYSHFGAKTREAACRVSMSG